MSNTDTGIDFFLVDYYMTKSWIPIFYIEEKFSCQQSYKTYVSKSLYDFILKNCRCSHCKVALKSLCRCVCGHYVEPDLMQAEFPHELEIEFSALWSSQRYAEACKRHALRRAQQKKQSGLYTAQQIETLFSVQGGCCYYCSTSLLNEEGQNNYHIDHYVPLSRGGRNEISNLVLACPPCNRRKSDFPPDLFLQESNAILDRPLRNKTKKIQKCVMEYKKSLKTKVKT